MPCFDRKVLVLDSRCEPMKVVSMEAGFVLLYAGRASCIEESNRVLTSVSRTWSVPWIVRLEGCRPKSKRHHHLRFSRQNIYLRDGFRCQYCHGQSPLSQLTLDHLNPVARGGKTTWENIVTACMACNTKKGAYTMEELGIEVRRPPARPRIHSSLLFPLRFGITPQNAPASWLPYIDFSALNHSQLDVEASPVFFPRWTSHDSSCTGIS